MRIKSITMIKFYSNNNRKLLSSIHKLNRLPGDEVDFNDQGVIMEYVVDKKQQNDFHLVSEPHESSCETLCCRLCGTNSFVIGQKEFFSALKCENCGYEVSIHEG